MLKHNRSAALHRSEPVSKEREKSVGGRGVKFVVPALPSGRFLGGWLARSIWKGESYCFGLPGGYPAPVRRSLSNPSSSRSISSTRAESFAESCSWDARPASSFQCGVSGPGFNGSVAMCALIGFKPHLGMQVLAKAAFEEPMSRKNRYIPLVRSA